MVNGGFTVVMGEMRVGWIGVGLELELGMKTVGHELRVEGVLF